MTPNWSKRVQMGPNGSELIQMCLSGSKWVQMGPNGSEEVWIGPNESKWLQLDQNGSKRVQIGPSGSKWILLVKHEYNQNYGPQVNDPPDPVELLAVRKFVVKTRWSSAKSTTLQPMSTCKTVPSGQAACRTGRSCPTWSRSSSGSRSTSDGNPRTYQGDRGHLQQKIQAGSGIGPHTHTYNSSLTTIEGLSKSQASHRLTRSLLFL